MGKEKSVTEEQYWEAILCLLKTATIHAAEHIGVQDRVGSLEVGKDADIVICDGCPFEISTTIEKVIIDGAVVAGA